MSLEAGSAFPKILVWRDRPDPNRALDKHDKRGLKSSKFSLSNSFLLSPATLRNGPLPTARRYQRRSPSNYEQKLIPDCLLPHRTERGERDCHETCRNVGVPPKFTTRLKSDRNFRNGVIGDLNTQCPPDVTHVPDIVRAVVITRSVAVADVLDRRSYFVTFPSSTTMLKVRKLLKTKSSRKYGKWSPRMFRKMLLRWWSKSSRHTTESIGLPTLNPRYIEAKSTKSLRILSQPESKKIWLSGAANRASRNSQTH